MRSTSAKRNSRAARPRTASHSGSYVEKAPIAALESHVACVWQFDGAASNEIQRVVPDGRCELIFHAGRVYGERDVRGGFAKQPRLLFAGQLTHPLHLRAGDRGSVLGVRFKPAGVFAYIGRALEDFTDRRAPLKEILGSAQSTALQHTLDDAKPQARHGVLQRHVLSRIEELNAPADELVQRCADRILAGVPGPRLLEGTSINPRTLQRRFRKFVGISPQMLAAIVRFRRVFEALQAAPDENWTAAAQRAGYFDHPQMGRDFQRFLGCSLSTFMSAGAGLAANLAGL